MSRMSYVNVVQGNRSAPHVNVDCITDHQVHEDETKTDDSDCHNENVQNSWIDNNSHPLFLHNHDHPCLVLIAKKLVGPDNYAPWSRSMQIALNARNKFVVVNGVFAKPAVTSPLYAQWERVNDMIITWILNSVTDEISDGLNFVNTAGEVWNELKER